MPEFVNARQLSALLTKWSQYKAHSLDVTGKDDHDTRMEFARTVIGRKPVSWKELTKVEASRLLDVLAKTLGQGRNHGRRGQMRDRDRAQAAGTEGRRSSALQSGRPVTLVSAADLARIDDAIRRLGWTRERSDAWLRSASSPLGKRSDKTIRTLSDANRVWWALKRLLQRAGVWTAADDHPISPQRTQRYAEEAQEEKQPTLDGFPLRTSEPALSGAEGSSAVKTT